jgi:hypothetical protein
VHCSISDASGVERDAATPEHSLIRMVPLERMMQPTATAINRQEAVQMRTTASLQQLMAGWTRSCGTCIVKRCRFSLEDCEAKRASASEEGHWGWESISALPQWRLHTGRGVRGQRSWRSKTTVCCLASALYAATATAQTPAACCLAPSGAWNDKTASAPRGAHPQSSTFGRAAWPH